MIQTEPNTNVEQLLYPATEAESRTVSPDIITEISQNTEKSRAAIKELFQGMQEYAEDHGGVYGEVHKIGESYIPLPAIVDTTVWGGENPGLGFVTEASGHTLAEIYHDFARLSDDSYRGNSLIAKEALEDLGVLDFVGATGLGSDRKTLCYRGQFTRNEDGHVIFNTRSDGNLYREDDPASLKDMEAGLEKLGIGTRVPGGIIDIISGDVEIGQIVVDIENMDDLLPEEKRNAYGIKLKVLTAIDVSWNAAEEGTPSKASGLRSVALRWKEGQAKRHDDLYGLSDHYFADKAPHESDLKSMFDNIEDGLPTEDNSQHEDYLIDLPFSNGTIKIGAEYDELESVPGLVFTVECPVEQLNQHMGDIRKIIHESERAIRLRDSMPENTPMKTTLFHREEKGELLKSVAITSSPEEKAA